VVRSSWRMRMPDFGGVLEHIRCAERGIERAVFDLLTRWQTERQHLLFVYAHERPQTWGMADCILNKETQKRPQTESINIRHLDKETHQSDRLHLKEPLRTHILRGQRGD
jgi:hypothetical protein